MMALPAAPAWSSPQSASTGADSTASPPTPEVKIIGKAKPVQSLIDRKVYNVAADLNATTGSAADVLNTLPSVDVDADGKVSLRGDSKVVILVDGRPSAQLSGAGAGNGLQQFSANDIEKVEVLTNPPAEYRADGTGVINIVTKKARTLGTSGTLLASAGNGGRYVAGASGAHNTGTVKLSGGLGLRRDDRERIQVSNVALLAPGGGAASFSNTLAEEHTRRVIPSLKAGLDYRINDDQSLSADLNFRQRSGERRADQRYTSSLPDGSLTSSSDRRSDGREWSMSGSAGLGFKQKLSGPEETVDLLLQRTTDRERERYAYLNTATLPASGPRRDRLSLEHDFSSNSFNAAYRNELPEGRVLKLGFNVKRDNNSYANGGDHVDSLTEQIIVDPSLTNQFRYRQTVQALYASWEQTIGKWGVIAGTRTERTVAEGVLLTTGQRDTQRYAGIYPSLNLERMLNDASTLSLSLGRRLARPDPDDLNPYVDRKDIHNLRSGNPNLRPRETDALDIGYRVETDKNNYGVTAYLRQSRNGDTDVTTLLSPDVLLSTKVNWPKSRSGGMEFNVDAALIPALSGRLSGNLFYSEFVDSSLGMSGMKSTTGLNLKGSLDYRPTRGDTAQLSFSRAARRQTLQGEVSPVNLVNLGYKHQLTTDLSLVATVSDVFNGQRQRRTVSTPALMQQYERWQPGRIAFVGLTYLVGAPKKSKAASFEYDQ
ncbi:TonB-dependent receptor domain-containing protein [Massilia horti]|nr:TonB-dependent receptor [Massilia horti]